MNKYVICITAAAVVVLAAVLLLMFLGGRNAAPIPAPDGIKGIFVSQNSMNAAGCYSMDIMWDEHAGCYRISGQCYSPGDGKSISFQNKKVSEKDKDYLIILIKEMSLEPYTAPETDPDLIASDMTTTTFELASITDGKVRYIPPQGEIWDEFITEIFHCIGIGY